MKVKLFENTTVEKLEEYINKFIEDKILIDVKYCYTINWVSALVVYKEETYVHPIGETIPVEGGIK